MPDVLRTPEDQMGTLELASRFLTDDQFLASIRACRLGGDQFRHADHLRLGWILTRASPVEDAICQIRSLLKNFAGHHGKAGRYHETITCAWMYLLASHTEESFAEFMGRHQNRLSMSLLHTYWSAETLGSQSARDGWVPPDIRPLPPPRKRAC